MKNYVVDLAAIPPGALSLVGGKALNLGMLRQMDGIHVPAGFCVTTAAFQKTVEDHGSYARLLEQLAQPGPQEGEEAARLCAEMCRLIAGLKIEEAVAAAIETTLERLGAGEAYAVRSSATAEDLPELSFAGQHDTFLHVHGAASIMQHVVKCWASLFNERAAAYRARNGIAHDRVQPAVIVQKMVPAEAAGVLFTADPATSDRFTIVIEAVSGLGEALVSGTADPDIYKVSHRNIIAKRTGARGVEAERRQEPVLRDAQILELAGLGRDIAERCGAPQDIEWCLAADQFHIVQSRPITTLFPPPASADGFKRLYMSAGHMQMMTDPIRPLGMSFFEMSALFPLHRAGGRLFADITHDLRTASGRRMVMRKAEGMDPLMAAALRQILRRKDYCKSIPKGKGSFAGTAAWLPWAVRGYKIYRTNDTAILEEMLERHEHNHARTAEALSHLSGDAVFQFILDDRENLKEILYDATSFGAILTCQLIGNILNKNLARWLGEKDIINVLSRSVEHNVTSEMGLALCAVADAVREAPTITEYLEKAREEDFWEGLERCPGGATVSRLLREFLDKFGVRCPGEIDITRPRWSEKPTALIPVILNDVRLLEPGHGRNMFEQGRAEAAALEKSLLERLTALPGGRRKAAQTARLISVFRNFVGVREYPKYYWMRRYALYKEALMKESVKLAAAGGIAAPEDTAFLYFDEFHDAVCRGRADRGLIERRREEYRRYEKLTPPRLIFSDGEVPAGEYGVKDIPEGALAGLAVSAGVVEGRARVIEKLEEAAVEPGDILVTAFTDPSWTPLFVSIAGVVTEVGGMMSHGAVITREYGLPAVVGVENATRIIKEGQRIRVNGSAGYVEVI